MLMVMESRGLAWEKEEIAMIIKRLIKNLLSWIWIKYITIKFYFRFKTNMELSSINWKIKSRKNDQSIAISTTSIHTLVSKELFPVK